MRKTKEECMVLAMKVLTVSTMSMDELVGKLEITPELCASFEKAVNKTFHTDVVKRLGDVLGTQLASTLSVMFEDSLDSDGIVGLVAFRLLLEKILAPLLDQIDSLKTTVKTMEISREVGTKREEKG